MVSPIKDADFSHKSLVFAELYECDLIDILRATPGVVSMQMPDFSCRM